MAKIVILAVLNRTMTVQSYLLLGSNRGQREKLLGQAIEQIGAHCGKILYLSSVYETDPWGFSDSTPFLNQVLMIETSLSPVALLRCILSVESTLGRTRDGLGYSSRTIDIDILLYGNMIVNTPEVQIPHPRLHLRRFALEPLNEINPDIIHPSTGKTVKELLLRCPDNGNVVALGKTTKKMLNR
ncbi:MAG TPA: 2-amino-4-hydroxy-6-hydroxymethyldihydropteridine diphosphokinase [Bacteroidales bacterium]|nr:2-amino-4-hydroxy-6-hydroxymethyldihydropteridine diphosphokinase [Bacteroidales bacterium]